MYVTRFELAAFWSVARRSIQLSYTYLDVNTSMPATGIEPVWEYKSRRILSPVRLPVPPHSQTGKKNGDPPATRTRDTLIKSQVLYRLS